MIAAAAIPRPPALPASLAALVLLAGVGLLYWSLTGLGLLTTGAAAAAKSSITVTPQSSSGSGYGGGSSSGGSGVGGGF